MRAHNLPKVAIIDYEMGNLFSIKQACEQAGLCPQITADKKEISAARAVILPGVGAFGDAMGNLKKKDLFAAIRDFIASNRPFLGVCLGMQLLFTESEEFGLHKGFGFINGRVIRFQNKNKQGVKVKVPQVGWNRIKKPSAVRSSFWDSGILNNIMDGEFMYFVHSFYPVPEDKDVIFSITEYGGNAYCSSVRKGNVFAFQFHPEKSACEGIKIYKNFADIIKNRSKEQEEE